MIKQLQKTYFIILSLLAYSPVIAQFEKQANGFWNLQSINGTVTLESFYRAQETKMQTAAEEFQYSSVFSGMISVNSKSYIWHPNFIQLTADAAYNPSSGRDRYLVLPDRSETESAEKFRLQGDIFSGRPFSISLFANYFHNYINRDFTTNVEMFRNGFGGSFTYLNKILPISIRYARENWEQNELQTGRKFLNNRESWRSELSKSFMKSDIHRLSFAFDDYTRDYSSKIQINNKISTVTMSNKIFMDKKLQDSWNSLIFYNVQRGSEKFERIQANENIQIALPKNFVSRTNYQYAYFNQNYTTSRQHNFLTKIEHQLFESLKSNVFYEHVDINQSSYNEYLNSAGFGLNYRKKIPYGNLTLAYDFRGRNENRNSSPGILQVKGEQIELNDDAVVLLKNLNIFRETIVVSNSDRSIIFEENIDYILLERGDYLEVQRLPGGQIENGESVLVDYNAGQQLSYQFDSFSNNYRASVLLFKNLIEIYFRLFEQDHAHFSGYDQRILNTVSQRISGARVTYGFFSGGIEIDDYNSNLVPYHSNRYFVTVNHRIKNDLHFTITGNLRQYTLTDDQTGQKFSDISGRIIYNLNRQSQIKFNSGFRFQDGRNVDLNLYTARAEFLTRYRKMYFTVGVEMYNRTYLKEKINYNGGFIKIERKF